MADLSAVLEQYRIQFNSIRDDFMQRYERLPQDYENTKDRLNNLGPCVSNWINMTFVNVKIYICDMSPIGLNEKLFRSMMEIYMWVSVCLLIGSMSFLLGSGAFYWLAELFFDVVIASLLSLVILPVLSYNIIRKKDIAEDERRTAVLISTMCIAYLNGYVLKERHLDFYPPPSFVTPLCVGLTAGLSSNSLQTGSRNVYLLVSVAPAFFWYAALGWATGSFALPYLIWTLAYCALGVFDFQVKLGQCWMDGTGVASNQILTIALYQTVGYVMNEIFGTSTRQ